MFVPLLHPGHVVNFSAWHLEPSILAGAFLVLILYSYGLVWFDAFSPKHFAFFIAGWLAIFLALASPLDSAAHRLLSMHMLQHVFLSTIGPPLVLLGLPPTLLRPLLQRQSVREFLSPLVSPVVAGPLFIVNMWFWHIPPIYETALNDLSVHITMHLCFMATGLLYWWPVIQPSTDLGRLSEAGRLLYLFATGLPMELLALLLIASGTVVYSFYSTSQGLWGISPINDQQIAGLIMGALGEIAGFIAITLLFFRFLDREEASEPPPAPRSVDAA
jgi:putative membrane protein